VGARTDIGCVRHENQDAFRIEPRAGLFLLSDGMGGAVKGGETAARTVEGAATTLSTFHRKQAASTLTPGRAATVFQQTIASINANFCAKNDAALADPASSGRIHWGATFTGLWLVRDTAIIAHVGDSRAYLLRDGVLTALTDDHNELGTYVRSQRALGVGDPASKVSELLRHILSSSLERCIGCEPPPGVPTADVRRIKVAAGDRFLLCSDGLHGLVPDDSIAAVLGDTENTTGRNAAAGGDAAAGSGGFDPNICCNVLTDLALEAGGYDNITAIVVAIGD
jgi:protein phosphatase